MAARVGAGVIPYTNGNQQAGGGEMPSGFVHVHSPDVKYGGDHIESKYTYNTAVVANPDAANHGRDIHVAPCAVDCTIRTRTKLPRLGLMMVGWGGNNGTTLTAAILANKLNLTWRTKDKVHHPNYWGSLTQAGTTWIGSGPNGEDVFVPLNKLLPMVDPNEIYLDGWDISSKNLQEAMQEAKVIDYDLQRQLNSHMKHLKPRKSVYWPDFIAANQADRADNLIHGTKAEQVDQLRKDIRDFTKQHKLEQVIVIWTANTERFCDVVPGVNDTAENLIRGLSSNQSEISPSIMYAIAAILEGCPYINGSPQNTFVPGVLELAERHGVFVGGDDLKSGQTKIKSVLVDFLVGAGIKPTSIVSYNHLGNNDGKNLSAPQQFRSKEVSKSGVVEDMVASNRVLYQPGETPDHCVVIKYVPYVGDSKRAMDEYTSELMLGGKNTIVMHNTCEDSLLAAPILLDMCLLAELCTRIKVSVKGETSFQPMHSVLSFISYLCKAPIVPGGSPIVNSLFRQRQCIENVMRACVGLAPINNMLLEHKLKNPEQIRSFLAMAINGMELTDKSVSLLKHHKTDKLAHRKGDKLNDEIDSIATNGVHH